jgi:hypothetical protein
MYATEHHPQDPRLPSMFRRDVRRFFDRLFRR